MMKKAMGFLFLLVLLSLGALAQADEILVGSEGAQTLTEAVAQAQPGDVLRLPAGVYTQETELYPIVIDKPLTGGRGRRRAGKSAVYAAAAH